MTILTNEILILTRCMRTRLGYRYLPFIREIKDLAKKYDLKIVHNRRGGTKNIRLLTVHASKGLEPKIVFLLNATNDTFGFPCLIEDSKIYDPARVDYPLQDSLEEERRIFYVAMTRAKEHFYIYTWKPAMSEFLNEIADYTKEIRLNY